MTPAAPEPQSFGKYQILDRIAAGGAAEVFRARLDGINGFHRAFAIKRLLPAFTADPAFVTALVEEAKVAGLLSHANIVQILDFGAVDQQYYIAMEYVHGRDLGRILARCREKGITLPAPHAVFILIEALKGLEYAHGRPVMRNGRAEPLNCVHGDLAPANVMVSFQGEVKLTDFGIARASSAAHVAPQAEREAYLSPEQLAGGAPDARSDLYAAGVVLYELLTGKHPFEGQKGPAGRQARRSPVLPPSVVHPDVPASLDAVVAQALAADPASRFSGATAFKEALDRFFHDSGFIFSANTLGNFIRGLFPDADARPVRPSAVMGDELELDEPSSTGDSPRPAPSVYPVSAAPGVVARALRPSTQSRELLSALRSAPPPGSSGTFGPAAGIGEESTLIRPSPTSRSEWAEAETVIRPGLDARQDPPTRTTVDPVAAPHRLRVVYRTPARVHLLWFLAAGGVSLVMFLSGALIGSRLSANAVGEKPIIEVQFPAGASVSVAGTPLAGPSPRRAEVPADTDVTVKLIQGSTVTSTTVRLVPHELRVLSFSAGEAKER